MIRRETSDDLEDGELLKVEVEALVILRIMKHCRANLPNGSTGQLLGLDSGDKLIISNCFEQPQSREDSDPLKEEEYQYSMMRMLRDVNIDANTVGWYQSTYMGSFLNEKFVDMIYMYQESIKKSVVLVFDPLQDNIGKCAFKAYRLKKEFFKRHRSVRAGENQRMKDLMSSDVFEEVPIVVNNALLVEAYLVEWALYDPFHLNIQFESLDLENEAFLQKNVTFLLECLEDLTSEQQKLQYHERQAIRQQQQQKAFVEKRRAENAARRERGEDLLPEQEGAAFKRIVMPSQLETLLISSQIQNYCKQISNYSSDAFGKLYLVGGFQQA